MHNLGARKSKEREAAPKAQSRRGECVWVKKGMGVKRGKFPRKAKCRAGRVIKLPKSRLRPRSQSAPSAKARDERACVLGQEGHSEMSPKKGAYARRVIDSGCSRTVVHDYSLLSGNISSINVNLTGIDPKDSVRHPLVGTASGDLELILKHMGKATKVVIKGAMYVPNAAMTLVSERDLGEAGVDVCKREGGTVVYLEKDGKVVGKYSSSREKFGGLYKLDDYTKAGERKPRFEWGEVQKALRKDMRLGEREEKGKEGDRSHLLCTDSCVDRGSKSRWGTEQCFLANSFHTGVNVASLYHQRLGHVSLTNPKLHQRLCEALGDS